MKKDDLAEDDAETIVSHSRGISDEVLKAGAARLAARRLRDILPGKIETRRLVLRAPIRGDVPDLVRLADNPDIANKLARLPNPYTRADALGFIEIFSQRADERPYAITLGGSFIGVIGFSFSATRPPELGYWLGEPFWAKGYMAEATKALIDAAQATHQFPKIVAQALPDNAASLKVLAKAGFRITGQTVNPIDGRQVVELELDQPKWL